MDSSFHFNADQTHAGIRFAALAILALVSIASYWVGSAALPLDFCALGGGSLAVGLAVAWLGETLLKRYWPSGRWIEVAALEVRFRNAGVEREIVLSRQVNQLRWRFKLSEHRSRGLTPANWECFAVQVAQGPESLSAFSFVPPHHSRRLAEQTDFHYLPAHSDALPLLKNPHAHYVTAERQRLREGMELEPRDFIRLMDALPRE